ncbi:MAG: hypothetical protein J6X29_04960, partial [Clostridia bacterium]|nr:hypothetical protein [Clostridia bacterium]
MSLTAVTPTNLVISDTGDEGTWKNAITLSEMDGSLFPATTSDGEIFNAITEGNYIGSGAGGVAEASTAFQPTASVGSLNSSATDPKVGYYAIYTMFIKLSEAQDNDIDVYLSQLDIEDTTTIPSGANPSDITPAIRVALF